MATPTPCVIFDDGLGLLSPLNDLRASFEIRTGAFTTLERLMHAPQVRVACWMAGREISPLVRERMNMPQLPGAAAAGPMLYINGRCPLVPAGAFALEPGRALVERSSGHVIAARVGPERAEAVMRSDVAGVATVAHDAIALMSRPWHLRAFRDACLAHDLAILLGGAAGTGEFVFRLAPTAKAHPSVIFDTEHGHIVVDEHAVIRPGAILVGPVYVGPHSTVLERSLIKGNTAIGPWCKVAGEVGGTIFQGFANKAHDGHLGDSWVGEWANLGAGTTNSNLLNTYGEVVARPLTAEGKAGSNERSGQQFLGATIGDHVKTAICTRIMTGAIVGTGTMFAASGPLSGTVAPLSWITDSGVKPFAIEKFVEVAKAAMGRRRVSPSEAYLDRLRTLVRTHASALPNR